MFTAVLLAAAAALSFTEADSALALKFATGLVRARPQRDAGTVSGYRAANWILDNATLCGADIRLDRFTAPSPRGERTFVNLYSEVPSPKPGAGWVVLLSHYDTKPGTGCPGANDGASTTALMVALAAKASCVQPPPVNLLFIWTDAEECQEAYSETDGFQGARQAAEMVRRCLYDVKAVFCLDMLGDRDLAITVPSNGDATLAKIAVHAARRIGEPSLVRQIPEVVKDDHVAFIDAGFRAIDLIDFDYGSAPGLNDWWHTPKDTPDKLSAASLLKAGKLVVELINLIGR